MPRVCDMSEERIDVAAELAVQRVRADRAYQLVAQSSPPTVTWERARDVFQIENDRLIALELRWVNNREDGR